jgi:transposase, IS5 family
MIRYKSQKQLTLPGFDTPPDMILDPNNRWAKLSECIPWDDLAQSYHKKLSSTLGRPAKDARIVIGAVIIKHKLSVSDDETVEQIRENPYLQYFIGLKGFQSEAPFAPSLFVEVRKRMGQTVFDEFHEAIIDASVVEQAIRFPTDLGLLNEARELSERIIDELHAHSSRPQKRKPRTYREVARKAYLSVAKLKRPSNKRRRVGIRQQLQFLRRNLGHIEAMLTEYPYGTPLPLSNWLLRRYWVLPHLFGQQYAMYATQTRRCDDRIVSISQPYIRPIIRGKQGKTVEFGAKISVSLTGRGLAHVDELHWSAQHEGHDLQGQVEAYKKRYGCYPEVVIADTAYGSRDNRSFLKQHNIRFAGKPLGRPSKITPENEDEMKRLKAQRRQEYRQRIPIEGKFGQGKYGYRLNNIRARRADTSTAWINSIFLVMNLLVLVQAFFSVKKITIRMALWLKNMSMFQKNVSEHTHQFISNRNLAWQ